VERGKSSDGQKEVSQQTFLKRLLFFLLRLSGTLAGVLFLVAAAWLHQNNHELLSIVCAEVAAVLLTVSIIHFAYDLFIRQQYKDEMRSVFQEVVRNELCEPANLQAIIEATREDNELIQGFIDHGVEGILYFPSDKLSKQLKGAGHIRILKTWFPEDNQLQTGFEEALTNRGTRIELLLCDPDYELLRVRSIGARLPADEGARRVVNALESIHRLRCEVDPKSCFDQKNRDCNTRVGLYKAWPGCPVIWCDDRIFLGYYFFGRSSLRSPWIKVKPESELAKILDRQFASLWKDGRTREFESCEDLGNWLAPRTKPRREKKGWGQKRRSRKPRQEMPPSKTPPDGSSDPSS
jgi:hypothetical protein